MADTQKNIEMVRTVLEQAVAGSQRDTKQCTKSFPARKGCGFLPEYKLSEVNDKQTKKHLGSRFQGVGRCSGVHVILCLFLMADIYRLPVEFFPALLLKNRISLRRNDSKPRHVHPL